MAISPTMPSTMPTVSGVPEVAPADVHRFSIEEYHRLIESGGLDEDMRVELIDGLVVEMSPRSPQHENAIRWLTDWLIDHLDRQRFQIAITPSLTLGASEPEPDLVVIDRGPYRKEHPSTARLVIEVALSSQRRDLRTKPAVYGPYVDEYWVIDLDASRIVVHRDRIDGAYGSIVTVPRGGRPQPTAVPLPPLDSSALFAAAFAEAPPAQ